MTAKDFLSQGYLLDKQIQSKSDQIESLNDLATKSTSTLTGMPRSPSPSGSLMANAVASIVDLQQEISEDMRQLVEVKHRIVTVIKAVDDVALRIILERRYLCGDTWEMISVTMNYNSRWTRRLHDKALDEVQRLLEERFPQYLNEP